MGLKEELQDDIYFFDMLQSDEFLRLSHIDKKGTIIVDEGGVEAGSGESEGFEQCEASLMNF